VCYTIGTFEGILDIKEIIVMARAKKKRKGVHPGSKSVLARLMAAENLVVEHRAAAETASFEPKNRVLTLPVWENMSNYMYDMLVAHEVSHALHTPVDGWEECAAKITDNEDYHDVARMYVNIVEDARIEKLIKRKFPGSVKDFNKGYKEMYDRDMFGLEKMDKDVNELPICDRVNMFFKNGSHLSIQFNDEEQDLVDDIAEAKTFDEVVELSKRMWELANQENELDQMPRLTMEVPVQGQSGDGDGSGDQRDMGDFRDDQQDMMDGSDGSDQQDQMDGDNPDSGSGNEDGDDESAASSGDEKSDSSEGEGEDKGSSASGDEKSDSSEGEGEDKGSSASGEGEDEGGEDKTEASSNPASGGTQWGQNSDKDARLSEPPVPTTFKNFEKAVMKLNSSSSGDNIYGTIPEVKDILVSYKDVYKNHSSSSNSTAYADAQTKVAKFRRDNQKTINYLVQMFERKKAAEAYKRSQISKTGKIDINRLHRYKIDDDIFLRSTVVPQGKNHGLFVLVDFSGSMENCIGATLKQCLVLGMFAKKVNIPFQFVGFTDYYASNYLSAKTRFSHNGGEMQLNDSTYLVEFLSSDMSRTEFKNALETIMLVSDHYTNNRSTNFNIPEAFYLGGTPLCEALVGMYTLTEKFVKKYNTEIMNAIVMTDGVGNECRCVHDLPGAAYKQTKQSYRSEFVVRDPVTKEHYANRDHRGYTSLSMLSAYRDRFNANMIGFYLCEDIDYSDVHRYGDWKDEYRQQFDKSGSCSIDNTAGYDEYYFVSSRGDNMHTEHDNLEITEDMDDQDIQKSFKKFAASGIHNKIILDKFVTRISGQLM
jgi:hypothetical protein